MKVILEEVEGILVGRIYNNGNKTSAFITPMKDNYHLFSVEQLNLINNQIF